MKDLFTYLDYREYLKDFHEERKSENYFYSFQLIGRRVGMDASYVAKVLSGQRHLPADKVHAFVELCSLTGRKAEYFENLVFFCRAKSEKETKTYFDRLIRLRAVKGYTLSAAQCKFYSKWHYTAIRAVLGLGEWTDQYDQIAQRLEPTLRPHQVEQAITFMLRIGLVERDAQGVLRPTERHIRSGQAIEKQAIRTFQHEMISMADRSLSQHAPKDRDISTLTVAIKKDTIEDIRKLIGDCREAIRQRIDLDKDPDCIYQLNVQLFPLTRNP